MVLVVVLVVVTSLVEAGTEVFGEVLTSWMAVLLVVVLDLLELVAVEAARLEFVDVVVVVVVVVEVVVLALGAIVSHGFIGEPKAREETDKRRRKDLPTILTETILLRRLLNWFSF